MTGSSTVFRVGTRGSKLGLAQTNNAVKRMQELLPELQFDIVPFTTPGDRDRDTDLRESPDDFFTRDLDDALLAGDIDLAMHSAKDLPDQLADGFDWSWLPWCEDHRDVLVLRTGESVESLSKDAVIGVSSDRRSGYCNERFPSIQQKPVRGNVEERVAQLDAGDFDMLVLAAAGLIRLGLKERITESISLDDLPTPDGQGYLAISFRRGDRRASLLRNLFIKPVQFVGAGPGDAGLLTVAGKDAIENCELCLHDALVSPELLATMPTQVNCVYVGKRGGRESTSQNDICDMLSTFVRRGKSVVRLKCGDPGLFARLAEETGRLDSMQLPYRVIPGVSSLAAATTGTGLTMTKRAMAHGYAVITPTGADQREIPVADLNGPDLTRAFLMGTSQLSRISNELITAGRDPATPCALVFNASRQDEDIVFSTLGKLSNGSAGKQEGQPAILLVGPTADPAFQHRHWGPLAGRRILLTCSETIMPRAVRLVHEYGGRPVPCPMIRLVPNAEADLRQIGEFDWIVITSPSAADFLVEMLSDIRSLPRILVSGSETARRLASHRIQADAAPADGGGTDCVTQYAADHFANGTKVLRLRSDLAGEGLAASLTRMGCDVTDLVLYRNEPVIHSDMPQCDALFFASSSAVNAAVENWGRDAVAGMETTAMGKPTCNAMAEHGIEPVIVSSKQTLTDSIRSLAAWYVQNDLSESDPDRST